MPHFSRSLSALFVVLAAPMAVAACSSDDDATPTTEVVVAGAPLSISAPQITADGDAIVGTIENVTDRTIEITSAASTAGEIEFRSADGSLLSSLKVEPNSALELTADGVHLALLEPTDDDSIDVSLGLDIQDSFAFTAERTAGG